MSVPQDHQCARELVQSIAGKHGYPEADMFAGIPNPDLRRQFEEIFLRQDPIGSSVMTYEQPVLFR